MMSEELKPCPFCGGENITINRFSIDCKTCGGSIRVFTVRDEAIKAWNQRHPSRNNTLDEAIKAVMYIKPYYEIENGESILIGKTETIKAIEQLKDK